MASSLAKMYKGMPPAKVQSIKAAISRAKGGRTYGVIKGAVGYVAPVAVGLGVAFFAHMMADKDWNKTHWWAMPAGLAVVGALVMRKQVQIGAAILGLAGFIGIANFKTREKQTVINPWPEATGTHPSSGGQRGIHASYGDAGATSLRALLDQARRAQRGAGEVVDQAHGVIDRDRRRTGPAGEVVRGDHSSWMALADT